MLVGLSSKPIIQPYGEGTLVAGVGRETSASEKDYRTGKQLRVGLFQFKSCYQKDPASTLTSRSLRESAQQTGLDCVLDLCLTLTSSLSSVCSANRAKTFRLQSALGAKDG
eukprot:GILJ01025350.1.p2 GENE.GILJ01025350.1~~GILJ01025350.1.p2  ORF type:complete len:111 (+),score=3.91 GILJ01025350.1:694-1026(+)